jgi:hypothetical protein
MAITDDIQRYMPSAADREEPRAVPLAYKEAVLLVDPKEPQFRGEVYTYIVIYRCPLNPLNFGELCQAASMNIHVCRWMTSTSTRWTTRTTLFTDGLAAAIPTPWVSGSSLPATSSRAAALSSGSSPPTSAPHPSL